MDYTGLKHVEYIWDSMYYSCGSVVLMKMLEMFQVVLKGIKNYLKSEADVFFFLNG